MAAPIQKLALTTSEIANPEIAPQFVLRPSSESVSLSNQACTNPVDGNADLLVQRIGITCPQWAGVLLSRENWSGLRFTAHLLRCYLQLAFHSSYSAKSLKI